MTIAQMVQQAGQLHMTVRVGRSIRDKPVVAGGYKNTLDQVAELIGEIMIDVGDEAAERKIGIGALWRVRGQPPAPTVCWRQFQGLIEEDTTAAAGEKLTAFNHFGQTTAGAYKWPVTAQTLAYGKRPRTRDRQQPTALMPVPFMPSN